jgi:hypothetical protein
LKGDNQVQKVGLILNVIGTCLFGYGALDRSDVTLADVAKTSDKAKRIHRFAWLGVALIIIGFILQFISIILNGN